MDQEIWSGYQRRAGSSVIISNLLGGLGNQMFQYAVGRMLSLKYGVPLRLDLRMFSSHVIHQGFELARVFSGSFTPAELDDLRSTLGWQSSGFALRVLTRPQARFIRSRHLVVEPHFQYFDGINDVPSTCYLRGNWQSERYFSSVASTLRKDFSFRLPFSEKNKEIAKRMSAVNAVSLHVRRGDYLSNPHTLSYHGVCSMEYYEQAIRHIAERVTDPVFFVFSDDLEWVKSALRMDHPCCYIDHNRESESYNDMRLMSLCSHHIIANSSFSWWGAWLNDSDTKIVVAPRQWFAKPVNVSDLLPDSWVRL